MTVSSPQKTNKLKLNLHNIEEKLGNPFQITPFLNFKHPQTNILLTYLPLAALWNYELGKHIPK